MINVRAPLLSHIHLSTSSRHGLHTSGPSAPYVSTVIDPATPDSQYGKDRPGRSMESEWWETELDELRDSRQSGSGGEVYELAERGVGWTDDGRITKVRREGLG
jgi:hypothetical protein